MHTPSTGGPVPRPSDTPFDTIRRTRADGTEYWSARDLQPLLGYTEWRKFQGCVDDARRAASVAAAQDQFVATAKMIEAGKGATREVADVEMTRYGAYMVAMSCDGRKPEVATAKTYFAVQTHRAETLDRALADGEDDALEQFAMMRTMLDNMERNHLAAKKAQADADRANAAAIEARVEALEARAETAVVSARLDSMENRTGYVAALGYAKVRGDIPTSGTFLNTLGRRASKIGHATGVPKGAVHDEKHGTTNTWPVPVWEAAVESLRAEGKIA